jgi:hypothetical protein
MFSMVLESQETFVVHSKKGEPRTINKQMAERLPHIGFKSVDIEVASIKEAWVIVDNEALKNHRFVM